MVYCPEKASDAVAWAPRGCGGSERGTLRANAFGRERENPWRYLPVVHSDALGRRSLSSAFSSQGVKPETRPVGFERFHWPKGGTFRTAWFLGPRTVPFALTTESMG